LLSRSTSASDSREDYRRGVRARLRLSHLQYLVQFAEGFNLPAAFRRVSKQGYQRRSESFSCAIALNKFRNNVFPQHKVSKDR